MSKDISMKRVEPTSADKALRDDIMALIQRHLTPDTSDRVLAIAAQVVGQCIAMQDQRTMTHQMVWKIVGENIEAGNRDVIETLNYTKGSA